MTIDPVFQIMYKNGISHLTAASDLDGALQIIHYLMFIPGM